MTFLGGAILLSHSSGVIKGTFIPKLHSPATLSGALLLLLGCDSIPSDSKSVALILYGIFHKLQETVLGDSGLFWHDNITKLLHIWLMQISPLHHIPKVLYYIEIWWQWKPFEYRELTDTSGSTKQFEMIWPLWNDVLSRCYHKGIDMISKNNRVGDVMFIRRSSGTKGSKVC